MRGWCVDSSVRPVKVMKWWRDFKYKYGDTMKDLSDIFNPSDEPAFRLTYYAYLDQLKENGQLSAIKETIEELSNEALISLIDRIGSSSAYGRAVQNEILKRMK